jgi:uncharacterized protein YbjT (DUF2867 family)
MAEAFVTGGTGYIGARLIPALLARGHTVRALVRPQSMNRLASGAEAVVGNALDAATFEARLGPADTLVQLVGTPHPGPGKKAEFERIDLASVRAATTAAARAGVSHLVYVSVAQPAPIMGDYIAVRAAGEKMITDARLTATFIRPWYVIGPGHRWPLALVPLYAVCRFIPALRDGARRTGLVTLNQMVAALVHAIESPPPRGTQRIVDVPAIRNTALEAPVL